MTKKKEPHEIKKRGRKEEIYENNDLRSFLAGVKHLNQLTNETRQVIKKHIEAMKESKASRKGVTSINVLFMLTKLGNVSKNTVKNLLDSTELFQGNDYKDSRVTEYKKLIIDISKELMMIHEAGRPIRVDDPKGGEYLTGEENYQLTRLLERNPTKKELSDFMDKIYPSRINPIVGG